MEIVTVDPLLGPSENIEKVPLCFSIVFLLTNNLSPGPLVCFISLRGLLLLEMDQMSLSIPRE